MKDIIKESFELAKKQIDEGWFKDAAGGLKDAGNAIKKSLADLEKSSKDSIKTTFSTNDGVKKFLKALNEIKSTDGIKEKNIALGVSLKGTGKSYTVTMVEFEKKYGKILLLVVDTSTDKAEKAFTVFDLRSELKKEGIKKVSRNIDGINCIDKNVLNFGKTTKDGEAKNRNYLTFDGSKLLSVAPKSSGEGADITHSIIFEFDDTEENKKQKKQDDELFT